MLLCRSKFAHNDRGYGHLSVGWRTKWIANQRS